RLRWFRPPLDFLKDFFDRQSPANTCRAICDICKSMGGKYLPPFTEVLGGVGTFLKEGSDRGLVRSPNIIKI
ncbi:MAG: hypothetical protein ACI3YH_01390, partial [Eubacteriales bacterium]